MAKKLSKNTSRQYAVVGLGRFGNSMARTLYEMGQEVLAIDLDEERVQEIAGVVTHAVQADATDEAAMKSIGIRNFDVVVIGIGDIQASILASLVLKGMGVQFLVAKALSELHGRVLEKVGADRVVYPERDMGIRVAHSLVSGNLIDFLELAPGYSIIEIAAPEPFTGRTLKQLDLRAKYGINIVAVRRGEEIQVAPGADYEIKSSDVLVAMGEDGMLERLETLHST